MRARALLAIAAMSTGLAATAVPASAQQYYNGAQNYPAQAYPNQTAGPAPYCGQVRQNRMMIGGAIGAVAGAVLGNNLGAHHHQGDGAILGTVAGAATGAMIGRNTGTCSPANQAAQNGYQPGYQGGYQQPTYGAPPPQVYGRQTGYDRYPLEGGPNGGYRDSGYNQGGGDPNCRWGTVSTRDPDGREVRDSIYMCRGRDGVWRAQQPY